MDIRHRFQSGQINLLDVDHLLHCSIVPVPAASAPADAVGSDGLAVPLTDHTIRATLAWSAITAFMACSCPIVAAAFDDTAAAEALSNIRPEAIRADMPFLADDLLEGRGTGTRGHEIAARFIATEFEGLGLEPAGDNSTFFQRVPFRDFRPDEDRTALSLIRHGKPTKFIFRRDFITYRQTTRSDTSVTAPVVYVGYGVTAPELGYDDYDGVDAKGKIVTFLYGAPPRSERKRVPFEDDALGPLPSVRVGPGNSIGTPHGARYRDSRYAVKMTPR